MHRFLSGMLCVASAFIVLSSFIPSGEVRDLSYLRPFICPAPLKDGDTVALFCPAGAMRDRKAVNRAEDTLRSWGFNTVRSEYIHESYHGFAGTTEERREEVLRLLRDPSVKCLFAVRGGFGSMKEMEGIPLDTIRKYPKWLVGFSDVTAMHSAWFAAGVLSIHGPMAEQIAVKEEDYESALMLRDMLKGAMTDYTKPTSEQSYPYNHTGHAEGRLVGGNLATIMPYLLTPVDLFSQGEDIILFIEEVGGAIRHIERDIIFLKNQGLLNRVKGIVCGHFTDCNADYYDSVEEMLEEYFAPLHVPVAYRLPIGHELPNIPVLHGASAILDVQDTCVTLRYVPLTVDDRGQRISDVKLKSE